MIMSQQKGKIHKAPHLTNQNPIHSFLFPQQNIQKTLFYIATSLTPKGLDSRNNDTGLRR